MPKKRKPRAEPMTLEQLEVYARNLYFDIPDPVLAVMKAWADGYHRALADLIKENSQPE